MKDLTWKELLTVALALNLVSLLLSSVAIILSALFTTRQAKLQENANLLSITIDLFREWRSEEFKESYTYIMRDLRRDYDIKSGFDLPVEARGHAIRVSHYLDNLGLLVYYGVVRHDLVIAFIGGAIIDVWTSLAPYIYVERSKRQGVYQEFFEHLAGLAKTEADAFTHLKLRKMPPVDPHGGEIYTTPA
jgi:hypothetical protein